MYVKDCNNHDTKIMSSKVLIISIIYISLFTINFTESLQQIGNNEPIEKGFCAPYKGKICKAYVSGQVWFSKEDPNGGWKNEQITSALFEEVISDLNGNCRQAAEVSKIHNFVYKNIALVLPNC